MSLDSVRYVNSSSSPAGPDYPTPSGDQSSPTVPLPDDLSKLTDKELLDLFWKMVNGMDSDQGDVAQGQLFDKLMEYMESDPSRMSLIADLIGGKDGSFNINGFYSYFFEQEAALATVYGYPGSPDSGLNSGLSWINNELAKFEALPPSQFRDQMISKLNTIKGALPDWFNSVYDPATKKFHFVFTSSDAQYDSGQPVTVDYYYDPNNPDDRDNSMIYLMIATSGISGPGTPNNFWSSFSAGDFNKLYQNKVINDMIKRGSSFVYIYMMFLMMTSDTTYFDRNAVKSAIDRTTNMIKKIQDELIKDFNPGYNADGTPKMSPDDAKKFVNTLLDSLTILGCDGAFSSQKDQYFNGSMIPELNWIPSGKSGDPSLLDLIKTAQASGDYTALAKALNDSNPLPPGVGNYTDMKNYLSAGNDVFTQFSKKEGVEMSSDDTKIGQYTTSLGDSAKTWIDFVNYALQHQIV